LQFIDTRKVTEEQQLYFFMLGLFEDDYFLFRNALIELGQCKLKPKEILNVIEDIRFFDTETKKRNYHKIVGFVELVSDKPMDTIKAFKQNKSGNLFGTCEDDYIDQLMKGE